MPTVKIRWLRHGRIASHRGDVPLTDDGMAQARERGRLLAGDLLPAETVHFMHAPTLRTRQTVAEIRAGVAEALGSGSDTNLLEVEEQWAIRNPDLYVAGQRVEMVSSAEALAEQLTAPPVDAKMLPKHPFFREFWGSPDRIGYWVRHRDPPGEDAVAVARRQMAFAMSLAERPQNGAVRYVLSTHSPVLRAILLCYMGEDPGEPGYLEPIDLILRPAHSPELRFRDWRRAISSAKIG